MNTKSTTDRLFDHYNTFTRRPTVQDGQQVIFKSFKRVLAPWLPHDRSTSIMDVACGEGALLTFLRAEGYTNLTGFDISPENVSICHTLGLTFVQQFDALRLAEFPGPKRFDLIFALDILEHLPKQEAAGFLDQVRQRLMPEGYFIVQTPNMGCVFGQYHRSNDLSHEFGLTEKSAIDLLMVAGFASGSIEIRPAWNATTGPGYLREIYLRLLHRLVFLAEGAGRPTVPTKNLLIRARRS
ncbi:MAG: class I SAM-dependent methyltransferase [Chloroflexi bacterium]|nr:class I SAM-dependent methyltransferase [Chloroflexota bacterium]